MDDELPLVLVATYQPIFNICPFVSLPIKELSMVDWSALIKGRNVILETLDTYKCFFLIQIILSGVN
jgi:hypothetical protein